MKVRLATICAVVFSIFPLVGLGMLAGAFFSYQKTNSFVKEAAKAEGTVVDLVVVRLIQDNRRPTTSYSYRPTIRFMNSQGTEVEFTSQTGSNPPSYSKGQKVEILYKPDKPQDARINDLFPLWGDSILLAGMGGLFLIIGTPIPVLIIFLFGERNHEYLKKSGVPIQTRFQRVELNTSLSMDGVHPFVVLTEWQDPSTSELHTFQSQNLWFDPSDHITSENITVFIEKNNPKKHYVDLSFLPKLEKPSSNIKGTEQQ
jgi:hypothetical protein